MSKTAIELTEGLTKSELIRLLQPFSDDIRILLFDEDYEREFEFNTLTYYISKDGEGKITLGG